MDWQLLASNSQEPRAGVINSIEHHCTLSHSKSVDVWKSQPKILINETLQPRTNETTQLLDRPPKSKSAYQKKINKSRHKFCTCVRIHIYIYVYMYIYIYMHTIQSLIPQGLQLAPLYKYITKNACRTFLRAHGTSMARVQKKKTSPRKKIPWTLLLLRVKIKTSCCFKAFPKVCWGKK